MRLANLTAAGALALGFATTAALAEYPDGPITMIIPYGPGGATDISARTLSEPLSDAVGQPLVMTNVAGAGGATGSVMAKNAEADGHAMLFMRVGPHSVSPAMKASLPYTLDDFRLVTVYEINPVACVVRPDSGIESVEDLVAKAKDDGVTYSTSGVGSLQQMAAVMVLREFGISNPLEVSTQIPLQSGGAAATAILNGTAMFLCTNSSTLAGFVKSGQLKPILVTTEEKLEGFDAPTAGELGKTELLQLVGWTGLAGPKGLPDNVAAKWSEWMATATEDPEFRSRMEELGSIIRLMSPEEANEFVRAQYETFRSMVEDLDMRIEG